MEQSRKALIGITSTLLKYNKFTEGVYVHQDYYQSIELLGGLPLVLPLTNKDTLMQLIDLCDGVIFSGGEDVDPYYYGREPHQQLGEFLSKRDEVEIAAIHYTIQQNKPLLAICRGQQILNVALGGTLYQDLSSQLPGSLQHTQKSNRDLATHSVTVEKASSLEKILDSTTIRVNSLHHQAIEQLAPSLRITALASDGVIEAVEDPGKPFLIGVQWHPESMCKHDLYSQKLFNAFLKACLVKVPS